MYFSIVLAHDGNVLRRYENDMSSEVCNEVGMALECSARRADGAGRYVRLDECGLAVEVDWHGGNGSPADPWRCTVTVRNDGSVAFEGVVRIDIPIRADGEPRFFLPGFMYGRNRGEAPLRTATKFPRLRERSELPASSWWMIRGDRLSNPCALAVTRSRVVGVVSSPYLVDRGDGMLVGHEACDELPFVQYAGFSCMLPTPGIVPCDDHASVGVTIGYENAPWLFVSSTDIRERPDSAEGPITLAPGGAAIMRLDVVDAPARDGRAIIPVLETVYRRFHEPPRQVGAPARAIRDIAVAVDRDAWLEDEHMYAGFVFDHHSPGDEIIEGKPYMYRRLGSSSWTNGMASAVPMLASAWRLGDDAMRRHALDGIEHIIQHCINPTNGLPYTAVEHERWSNRGWWFDGLSNPGHSGYLVGQTMYSALRAWQIERRFGGIDHSDWLKIIGNVIPRLAAGRNAVGEYPFVFDEMDGSGAEYESFGGVWCLAASAYWALLTGDHSDLDGMLLSERHYHDRYVAHMECYGAPLDTSKAVDSEGILGYIKAVGCLYAITGDAMYLDRMREAFAYECSFRFCWNSPVGVPPLNEVGWSSCGGSVTSTSNAHIHPMWNPENHLIKFIPETEWTDPSYHLPHFYEVFAERADEADRPFWAQAAKASREYLVTACHPQTGMNPEYSNYDGTPHVDERDHWHFYSDAYRTAGNIGLDCLWNGVVPDLCDANARLQRFFLEHDRTCVYAIDGTPVDETVLHPVGFIATTAEGSLAAMHSQEPDALDNAIRWVRLLWDTPIRTGTRRYYDNFLYAFAFLALAGEYRVW